MGQGQIAVSFVALRKLASKWECVRIWLIKPRYIVLSCTRGKGQACCNGRCNGVQRGSTCAPVALVPARARAQDDNYHALPSTGNLWRSTRATASLLWGKTKRESGLKRGTGKGDGEGTRRRRERGEKRERKEEECTCINFAPRHAAHTRAHSRYTFIT